MLDLTRLSAEQRGVVLAGDGPLLVIAGPGSGKTTVLAGHVAHLVAARGVAPSSVLAVTFTTAAARELRTRLAAILGAPGDAVDVTTLHALGLRIVRQWSGLLGLGQGPVAVYGAGDARHLLREAAEIAGAPVDDLAALERAVERYRLTGDAGTATAEPGTAGVAAAVAAVAEAYERLLERRRAVDYPAMLALPLRLLESHAAPLRLYQDAYRYVLCDEAQDLCRIQYALVRLLAARHRNLLLVGDPRQCVPAGTLIQTARGEIAVEAVAAGDVVVAAAGRGRLTSASVQNVHSRSFAGQLVRVSLRSGRVLRLTPDHMCFARLGIRSDIHYVYLMYRHDLGYRIGITVGARPDKRAGTYVCGLLTRTSRERADKTWVLRVCASRAEAGFYEHLWSVQYGIPKALFHPDSAGSWDKDSITRLFASIDTRANAVRLMADLGLHERYPHHRPQALTLGGDARRLLVHLSMFGGNGGSVHSPWSMHRMWLNSSDGPTRGVLERRGVKTRSGARGTWRIERHFRNVSDAVTASERLAQAAGGVEIVRTAMLTSGPRFTFQPASHLRPSMVVPVLRDQEVIEDEVVSVDTEPYQGQVYDLDVQHLHNYSASGVIVHNCLYGWRGADERLFTAFLEDFPEARVHSLDENFRASGRLVELANAFSLRLGHARPLWTRNPPGENPRVHAATDDPGEAAFVAGEIQHLLDSGAITRPGEVAVLYRTNRQAQEIALALRLRGVPYRVRGGGDLFSRREVQDAVAYLRVAHNPADWAALARIVNVPPRRLARLATRLGRAADAPAELDQLPLLARDYGPAAMAGAEAFVALVRECHQRSTILSKDELLSHLLERSGYREWLVSQSDGAERLTGLDELARVAGRSDSTLSAWLDELQLGSAAGDHDPGAAHCAQVDGAVLLTTVHAAKGGEWPVVFLVGVEEGILPHRNALSAQSAPSGDPAATGHAPTPDGVQDERRVAYVAVTRPRDRLYVTYCRERERDGQRIARRPSRFLQEVPAGLLTRLVSPGVADPAA